MPVPKFGWTTQPTAAAPFLPMKACRSKRPIRLSHVLPRARARLLGIRLLGEQSQRALRALCPAAPVLGFSSRCACTPGCSSAAAELRRQAARGLRCCADPRGNQSLAPRKTGSIAPLFCGECPCLDRSHPPRVAGPVASRTGSGFHRHRLRVAVLFSREFLRRIPQ